jgi:response regulator RpfG family c-di-GMP phosphodiesterase
MFEALTSDRPYRLAWTTEWALHYIENSAGQLSDPSQNVVPALSTIEEPEKLRAVTGG